MVSLVGRFTNWVFDGGIVVKDMWHVEVCGAGLQNGPVTEAE
jgi:hypothetical protein